MSADIIRDYELEELEQFGEDEKQRFKIEDADQLNWAMRKIRTLNGEKKAVAEQIQKEIARLNEWMEREHKSLDNQIGFFEGLITEFAMNERNKDPKYKKTKSPYGEVKFRKQQPQYVYNDDLLVEFLETAGFDEDLVTVKKVPNKVEIKKRFNVLNGRMVDPDTGEVIEGVEIRDRGEVIDIKVTEE